MSHHPIDPPRPLLDGVPQLGDIFDGYGLVHDACRWIIDVSSRGANSAHELDRAYAAKVLEHCPRLIDGSLDGRMTAAVLRRFPETVDPAVDPVLRVHRDAHAEHVELIDDGTPEAASDPVGLRGGRSDITVGEIHVEFTDFGAVTLKSYDESITLIRAEALTIARVLIERLAR